jgi:hypothetical protein
MTSKGCECKGSVEIHEACLQEWIASAENPFQCSVCKTEFKGTFLNKFMSVEEILYHGEEEIEDELIVDGFDFHGIPVLETDDGYLLFKTTEHQTIYDHTLDQSYRDLKYQSRRQTHHQNKHRHNSHKKIRSVRY